MLRQVVVGFFAVLITAVLIFAFTGCKTVTPPATFRGEPVRPLIEEVVDMHDSYVEQDPDLALEVAQSFLQEASNLRALAQYEQIRQDTFAIVADPILTRYEVYIAEDTRLTPLEVRIYLRSAEVLREFFPEE